MSTYTYRPIIGRGTAYAIERDGIEVGMVSLMEAPVWPDVLMRGVCDLLEIDAEVGP